MTKTKTTASVLALLCGAGGFSSWLSHTAGGSGTQSQVASVQEASHAGAPARTCANGCVNASRASAPVLPASQKRDDVPPSFQRLVEECEALSEEQLEAAIREVDDTLAREGLIERANGARLDDGGREQLGRLLRRYNALQVVRTQRLLAEYREDT